MFHGCSNAVDYLIDTEAPFGSGGVKLEQFPPSEHCIQVFLLNYATQLCSAQPFYLVFLEPCFSFFFSLFYPVTPFRNIIFIFDKAGNWTLVLLVLL